MTLRQRLSRWRQGTGSALRGAAAGAVIIAVLVLGYFGPHWMFERKAEEAAATGSPAASGGPAVRNEIELTPEKIAAAKITVQPVGSWRLLKSLTVAASVRYDETRYLELRSPLEGVVLEVLVKPGDTVGRGAPLLTLSAEAMGEARRERARCAELVKLAESQAAWSRNVRDGVLAIIDQVHSTVGQEPGAASKSLDLANQKTGQYGERLLKAYSAWELANANLAQRSELSQVLSARELREREAALRQAAAAFQGESEQIRFDAEQQVQSDAAAVADARNRLAIAQDKVAALLGPTGVDEPDDHSSRLRLTAPFAGRIEALHLVAAERVDHGESLLVLADAQQCWVAAEVAENQLPHLQTAVETPVQVRTPGQEDSRREGKIRFVGPRVDSQTRTIPIVIDLQNPDGVLRPGMFVWVDLPLSSSQDAVTVPASALARHDRDVFVFVQDSPTRFRRVSVELLGETAEWAEIVSTQLPPGTPLVDGGVFYLKSELLLEAEE